MAVAADVQLGGRHGPEKPAMSQPQKKMPQAPAVSPAMIDERKASHVESSSPAQWHGIAAEPVKPARLKMTGS